MQRGKAAIRVGSIVYVAEYACKVSTRRADTTFSYDDEATGHTAAPIDQLASDGVCNGKERRFNVPPSTHEESRPVVHQRCKDEA